MFDGNINDGVDGYRIYLRRLSRVRAREEEWDENTAEIRMDNLPISAICLIHSASRRSEKVVLITN